LKLKKIAFIKFGGLSSGGTEVSFQNVAKYFSTKYCVDYFYCDSAPYIGSDWVHPDTDSYRKKFMENSNVNLRKFDVEFKDVTNELHTWVNTNFWEVFNEKYYDLVFITTAGKTEYPYNEIKSVPIVNIVTVNAGINNQENIVKTILISEDSAKLWLKQGGNEKTLKIIPLCREEINKNNDDLRKSLNLQKKFIFGFHQREDDTIFSEIPLKAYKKIADNLNYFLLLGGSKKYSEQAKDLNIKNFLQLKSTSNLKNIYKFLNTLDVFTHGRKYGETMGLVLIEAMRFGLPVLSHKAKSNAQIEVIGNAGSVFAKKNIFSYANKMKKLQKNKHYYEVLSTSALQRYENCYSTQSILKKYDDLVNEIF